MDNMRPRHYRTSFFIREGLFNDLTCFADLESRIGDLPGERDRTEALEVFAEAFLVTRRINPASEIWPLTLLPFDIRRKIFPPTGATGANGICKLPNNEIQPYQVLFRAGRPTLTNLDVSKFLKITGIFYNRFLLTNCVELPTVLLRETGVYTIRGCDLDRLEKSDFMAIRLWLQGGGFTLEPRPILPFHEKILQKITPDLERLPRFTVTLSPGCELDSWVLSLLQRIGKRHLVLCVIPSVERLRTLYHRWLRQAIWSSLNCLMAMPESKANASQLDFPLTNNPELLRNFLSWSTQGVRVLFCQYTDLSWLEELLKENIEHKIHFSLFLDAHGLTLASPALQALESFSFSIPKQIFCALLPKLTHIGKQNRDGDRPDLFNLHAPEQFGPLAYAPTLFQLHAQSMGVHMRVMLDLILSEPIVENDPLLELERDATTESSEQAEETPLPPITSPAWQTVLRAMEQQGVRQVWTMHDTPAAAQLFIAQAPEGIETILAQGILSNFKKRVTSDPFRAATRAVMAMDISLCFDTQLPEPGIIFFFNSKFSPGTGYLDLLSMLDILPHTSKPLLCWLPLFVAKEYDFDSVTHEALFQSFQSSHWELLQLLVEMDQELALALVQMRVDLGHYGKFSSALLLDKIQIQAPGSDSEILSKQLLTLCLEQLTTPWDEHLGRLTHYGERFGDIDVEKDWPEDPELSRWVELQRKTWKQGRLSTDRIQRLEELGFIWDPEASHWEELFSRLLQFKREHGHAKILDVDPSNEQLSSWARQNRRAQAKGQLSEERYQRLTEVGFVWDLAAAHWEEMFTLLQQFKLRHGHALIGDPFPENPELGVWAANNRKEKSKESFDPDRVTRLDSVGFVWDLKEAAWEEMFHALEQFIHRYGHGKIPEYLPENPELALWVRKNRKLKLSAALLPQHEERLQAVGFCWDLEQAAWEEMLEALEQFRAQHDHCEVPSRYPANPSLAEWVARLRKEKPTGKLSPERIERLEQLGFVWDPEAQYWQKMFQKAVFFKEQFGHLNVPMIWPSEPELEPWIGHQRRLYLIGKMPRKRVEMLEEIGFIWDRKESEWEEMFSALLRFRVERKHCVVPKNWKPDPRLAQWVERIRRDWKKGMIPSDKEERLKALDFVFDTREVFWEQMFADLMVFREENGHCNLPATYPENTELAWWVEAQRKAKQRDQLSPQRLARLEAVGFIWDAQEAIWLENFAALIQFKESYGHCLVPRNWPENPALAQWVAAQRNGAIRGLLTQEKIDRLVDQGFEWDPKVALAEEMFVALYNFNKYHHHCNVPVQWPDNPELGMWLQFQRQAYREGKLDSERIRRLEEMGVVWE
ncbi:MAG: helicase associated domain-containing protein [Magnetococcus sp. DMHC-6]